VGFNIPMRPAEGILTVIVPTHARYQWSSSGCEAP